MNALHLYDANCAVNENFDMMSDEELLVLYRDNDDRAAFEKLVKRYERELYNYLRMYLNDAAAAEDVFQATFFLVVRRCQLFDEKRTFRPWLYRIAINQAIDAKRKKKGTYTVSIDENYGNSSEDESMWNAYSSQLISNEINPYDYASEKEQGQQVREAVERLPEMLRQVLYLVYFQGMKCREASKALGIPISIVRKRLNAAVKKLYFMLVKAVA